MFWHRNFNTHHLDAKVPHLADMSKDKNDGRIFQHTYQLWKTWGDSVPEKYSAPCYHYHVTYLGSLNDGNLKETFSECDDILSEDMVKYCYYGFGRQLSAQSISIDELQLLCTIGERSEYHKYCLTGMMMTVINVNENPDLGFLFCGNISEQYREFCYEGLGRWVKMLHLDQTMQQAECEKAGDEYAKVCLDADFDSIKLL